MNTERTESYLSKLPLKTVLNEDFNSKFIQYKLNELGLELVYISDIKHWYKWDGQIWCGIETLEVKKLVQTLIQTSLKDEIDSIQLPAQYWHQDRPECKVTLSELQAYLEIANNTIVDMEAVYSNVDPGKKIMLKEVNDLRKIIEDRISQLIAEPDKKPEEIPITNLDWIIDTKRKAKLYKFCSHNGKIGMIDNTLRILEIDCNDSNYFPHMPVRNVRVLDNGTYNFENFTFENDTFTKEDKLKSKLDFAFDVSATSPHLEKSMGYWFPDEEVRRFAYQFLGYILNCRHNEKYFFFLYGGHDCGKSRFIDFLEILYDFKNPNSIMIPGTHELFMSKNSEGRKSLQNVIDKGIIYVNEIGATNFWDTGLIKAMTGGDNVSCRILGTNNDKYNKYYGVLLFTGNNKPMVASSNTDPDFWDTRPMLIPFDNNMILNGVELKEDSKRNKDAFLDKFRDELPGIFNRCVEGYRDYKENGFVIPQSIKEELEEYKHSNNPFKDFELDCLELYTTCDFLKLGDIYEAFSDWIVASPGRNKEELATIGRRDWEKAFQETYKEFKTKRTSKVKPRYRIRIVKNNMNKPTRKEEVLIDFE